MMNLRRYNAGKSGREYIFLGVVFPIEAAREVSVSRFKIQWPLNPPHTTIPRRFRNEKMMRVVATSWMIHQFKSIIAGRNDNSELVLTVNKTI